MSAQVERATYDEAIEMAHRYRMALEAAEAERDAAVGKAKGYAVEAGFNKGRRERAEAELAQARGEMAMMVQRFEDRAAWCLMGAPNEWMQGEAKAWSRAALDLRAFLASGES